MDLGLKNKVAIVTGASKGMGLATVKRLLDEGVKVMMVARNESRLNTLKNEFESLGGKVKIFAADVAGKGVAEKVVEQTIKDWGKIDILINNAGGPPMGSFLDFDDKNWLDAINTNLLSCIYFSKAVAPHMKKHKWGRIVSITSTLAKEPAPVMVLSSTVRAGVGAFTKAISLELAADNITANVICPGGVLTDRLIELIEVRSKNENEPYEKLLAQSEQGIPAKRFADPVEIADSILFLVSEKGSYINGVSLAVDGSLLKSF